MINNLKTFTFAYFQVLFVSLNVYFISKENFLGIAVSSFMINTLWMLNVRGTTKKFNLLYPLGAMLGCISGVLLGNLLN